LRRRAMHLAYGTHAIEASSHVERLIRRQRASSVDLPATTGTRWSFLFSARALGDPCILRPLASGVPRSARRTQIVEGLRTLVETTVEMTLPLTRR
jgi:hypothetical protein